MFLAAVAEGAADPIASAANAIIQTGVLGALLVGMTGLAILAVLRWNKATEARVKDQKEASEAMTELTTSLRGALMDQTVAMNALRDTQLGTSNALREALTANTAASTAMRVTLDGVVRDAVRGYQRRMSPPGGTPATGGGA